MSLVVDSVSVKYENIQVLWRVSIKVEHGEIISLIGANGAGKSTLLRSIMGVMKPISGDIIFESKRLNGLMPHAVVRHGVSYVPEGRRLFGGMCVEENLRMGAPRRCDDLVSRLDFVYSIFPNLKERKKQHAGTLSGGEQQMVAIGRALMAKPKILLLDELSFGLSPKMFETVLGAVAEANRAGVSILLAEQNAERALEFSSRAYIIENGRITGDGKSNDLLGDPRIKQAYLGVAV
ncbi:MAG: ABC transporter ATP-binding protein [Nitrososphaerales archaeon]